MALTGVEGERRSTLRYGYLVNRALATAALDRAESLSRRLSSRFAERAQRTLGAAQEERAQLAALERHALEVHGISIELLLDEVTEQITDRDLTPYLDVLRDLGRSQRPLEDLVLSTDEVLRLSEYAYERTSRGLALDSVAAIEQLAGDRGGTRLDRSEPTPPQRPGGALAPHPAHWQQAYGRAFAALYVESETTKKDDETARRALGEDTLGQLGQMMRGWFSPFFDPRTIDLPPIAESPAGRLF